MFSCDICEIFKNICFEEHLPKTPSIFASPQNTITNSSGKFGLDETTTECKVSIFLNVTILFNQMQPYRIYTSLKNVSLTFTLTFL